DLAGRWHDNPRAIRAWTLLARLQPASDVVVVGLGEAQFQAGDRAAARRTWAALRRRASSPAGGHLRLGEILLDHELTHEARDDVETALFLAEAEQRAGDLDGATNTLRAVAERLMAGTPGTGEAAVEAGFALARLLKRQGRLDDAQARLDELARALPGRAREA